MDPAVHLNQIRSLIGNDLDRGHSLKQLMKHKRIVQISEEVLLTF